MSNTTVLPTNSTSFSTFKEYFQSLQATAYSKVIAGKDTGYLYVMIRVNGALQPLMISQKCDIALGDTPSADWTVAVNTEKNRVYLTNKDQMITPDW